MATSTPSVNVKSVNCSKVVVALSQNRRFKVRAPARVLSHTAEEVLVDLLAVVLRDKPVKLLVAVNIPEHLGAILHCREFLAQFVESL